VDGGDVTVLIQLLHDWEIWVADLLETHLSYPTLGYFRSQHENQSWVGALALILDVSAYALACGAGRATRQAGFTFAMARHAVGDLSSIFVSGPRAPKTERLTPDGARRLWEIAISTGLGTSPSQVAAARLTAIREAYEPYLEALATYLLMPLPPWVPVSGAQDNWESTSSDFASPVALFGPESPFKAP
jgi:hypothetical protein